VVLAEPSRAPGLLSVLQPAASGSTEDVHSFIKIFIKFFLSAEQAVARIGRQKQSVVFSFNVFGCA
jgi:hypothetical protein